MQKSFQFPKDRSLPLILIVVASAGIGLLSSLSKTGRPPLDLPRSCHNALFDGKKLVLNKANITELSLIPKISRKVATAIVSERERNGNFRSFSQLDEVSGVGPRTLEILKKFGEI